MFAAFAIRYSQFSILLWNCAFATEPPSRIITIAPNAAEIICELGECDRIVGVDKFCVYPPELTSRPKVGGLFDPDLERIITLRPDLVIIRGRADSLEQLCRERKIKVYQDKTERLSDIATTVAELGVLLQREAQARKLVEEFNGKLQAIRDRAAKLPRPRVLLTVSRRPDELSNILTAGKNTFLNDMLEVAGGLNVFGDSDAPWPTVSVESIVARQPEVIIELMPELEASEARQAEWIQPWRQLGALPAVSQRRVFYLTDNHVLIPSIRYPVVIDSVSRLIHEAR